jgi:hypothetical protein
MKTTAERTSATVSRSPDVSHKVVFRAIQTKLTVNVPGDKHERQAEATADRIMRMPSDDRLVQRTDQREPEKVQRAERIRDHTLQKASTSDADKLQRASLPGSVREEDKVQRAESGPPVVPDAVQAGIRGQKSGGRKLDGATQRYMESRFGADFGEVRVHNDAESARLSNRVGARAFTTGNHIFFAADQYRPGTSEGRHLLAHELTHTIQQGAAIQRSPMVSTTTATPFVQRLGISDALDYFADQANFLPGFRMLTIILGFYPLNMASVDRSAGNILRALIELLPLGTIITSVLEKYGVFQRAGEWVEQRISAFANIGGQIRKAIDSFLDSLSLTDVFHLGDVWERAKSIFTGPITNLKNFALGLLSGLMELVRGALLRPLAELLRPTRGYDLLCAVLGRDPVTGDAVPRNADTLIGGFMKLIGREDIWENIKKGNAVARAWAWFQGALSALIGFVQSIPGMIIATLQSITWQEVVVITGVVSKVIGLFVNIAGQFFSWASGTVLELLEIIFSVVAPGVITYIKKAQTAFRTIVSNPIGFVGNLVRAGRLGFELFAQNIVEHLKAALVKWITGPLGDAGVYIPKSFGLIEIIKLVLSVLGLTWQNIRAKLVKIIPEPVLVVLEKTASILVTLVTEGPIAAWEQIKAELNELKSMLIAQVTSLVSTEIVKAAVTKIVSMINPAGAVIQAIIAIYNTIMFFVERISQIAATVGAFVDSIAAIAAGQLTAAAQKVEQTMANTLVLVVSFLARLAGLGGIPQKIVEIIRKIRQPIDKGLDRIVAWLGALLKKIGAAAKAAAARFLEWWKKKFPVSGGEESHSLTFEGERGSAQLVLKSTPERPSEFLENKAASKKITERASKTPVTEARTQEKAIAKTQVSLGEFDDNEKVAVSGTDRSKAEGLSKKLDKQLEDLAGHIGVTLEKWGVADRPVKKISVPRKSFTYEMKSKLADTQKDESNLRKDSEGRLVNVKKGLARRHIVSSYDMSKHYEKALKGKKVSEAKLKIEQRGSAPTSLPPVDSLSEAAVEMAANERHHAFFGYTMNLFIGDSAENSSIQEELDRGKPGMGEKKLLDHVSRIKRMWALDSSITISGLDE